MKVWLLQVGEPLPTDDNGNARLFRTGMLAEHLASSNHDVTWWTSDFYHQKKLTRFGKFHTISISNNYRIHCLPCFPYLQNISLKRIINHYQLMKEFKKQIVNYSKPDVIVASFPSIELCYAAVKYAKKNNIPIVLDIRDLWPEVFLEPIPGLLRPIARLLLQPYYSMTKYIFNHADTLTGITDEIVNWGCNFAGRVKQAGDHAINFAYDGNALDKNHNFTSSHMITKPSEDTLVLTFTGTLGNQFDFSEIFDAIRCLRKQGKKVIFYILGDGPQKSQLEKISKDLVGNVQFLGWVDKPTIEHILSFTSLGVAPYVRNKSFLSSIPNKAVEYLSFSVPVLSRVQGTLGELIQKEGIGFIYKDVSSLESILVDRDIKTTLGEYAIKANEIFRNRFSKGIVMQSYEYLIKQLTVMDDIAK